jgi:hypothetical protein
MIVACGLAIPPPVRHAISEGRTSMRPSFIIVAAAGFAALPILCGPAWAQANRTFVSGHGSDTNPCTLAAPCRSFVQALTQTNAGGEIAVLDTAGYGTVTINKSVSIVNQDGVEAGVTTTSAVDGITVNVGVSDVVNLRGLTLVGGGVGTNGITFNNLGALNIQNCVIRGFTSNGISLVPAGTAAFNISDTIVSNIVGIGIAISPAGGGTTTAALNHVQVNGAGLQGINVSGANGAGTLDITIANSAVSNNSTGIVAGSTSGAAVTQVMVSNSVLSNNGTGVADSGINMTIYLAKNTIAGNTTAFNVVSGSLFSFGDNYIKSNGDDGGAISLVSTK